MRNHLIMATAGLALIVAAPSRADPLPVGGYMAISGTTSAAEPLLAGTVLADKADSFTFSAGGGTMISGTLQSRVVRGMDGTIDLYWRLYGLSTDTGQPSWITSLRLGNLGLPVAGMNANYRTDGLGTVGPDQTLTFSADPANLNFLFGGSGLSTNSSSYFMMLDSSARGYNSNAVVDLVANGRSISALFSTYGLSAGGVPEPSSWALMIMGVGATGGAMRRRTARRAKTAIA